MYGITPLGTDTSGHGTPRSRDHFSLVRTTGALNGIASKVD